MQVAGVRMATLLNEALAKPVDPRFGCDKATLPAPGNLAEPENIDFFKAKLLYYRCTSYENDVADVLKEA